MTTWSGFLDVEGQKLAVNVQGENPSLLLVNGVGAGRSMWEGLRAALPAGLGTVAFDAPGCGESPPARSALSVGDQARLVVGVARALGLRQVDVLGFSFGGMIAQQVARDSPELVRRLVLVSTAFGIGSLPGSSLALMLLACPQLLSSPSAVDGLGRYVFGGELVGAQGGSNRRRALRGSVAHPSSYVGQLLAGAGWSSLPWLAFLPHRALVVAGDQDPLVPVYNSTTLTALIRRSELHVVRGGGHLLVVDRAKEVAAAAGAFLARS